jgi:hypothetical protein
MSSIPFRGVILSEAAVLAAESKDLVFLWIQQNDEFANARSFDSASARPAKSAGHKHKAGAALRMTINDDE